jgi:hypothetical protein
MSYEQRKQHKKDPIYCSDLAQLINLNKFQVELNNIELNVTNFFHYTYFHHVH